MKFDELQFLFRKDMKEAMAKKPDKAKFIAAAYQRAMSEMPLDQTVTLKKLRDLELTPHMMSKAEHFLKSPHIIEQKREEIKLWKLQQQLKKIPGIGDKKAMDLIKLGVTSPAQLKQKKFVEHLSKETLLHLQYNIIQPIPREKIDAIKNKLTKLANCTIVIGGSYRRKKPFSNDIDILFLPQGATIEMYIDALRRRFEGIYIYANGQDKVSLILSVAINDHREENYKADIFICTKDNFYSMLLYMTGSKDFNIYCRAKARRLGYVLNQNGIFKNGKKINKAGDDEKKLLQYIDVDYISPEKR